MIDEPIKENPCENFPSYAEERDASVIVAHLSIAFPFVKVDDRRIFEFLGGNFLVPYDVYQLVQLVAQQWSSMLVYLCWYCISTWSLARG